MRDTKLLGALAKNLQVILMSHLLGHLFTTSQRIKGQESREFETRFNALCIYWVSMHEALYF